MALEQDHERCLDSLVWATHRLGGKADQSQLGKTADLIIQTMTGPWRFFHTPEHVFEVGGEVGEAGDAIEVLAALFHDLVYVQVDQGVSVNISSFISSFVKEEFGKLIIREQQELKPDQMFDLVAAIFGFSAGQALPLMGQNEFLSAVIAAKALENSLSLQTIAEITTCIEATIPFRSKTEAGESASDRLFSRLATANRSFSLGWTDKKLEEVVKRAIRVANRDVFNFASPSSAHFLDNTWNLLPETNHDLTNTNSYTVQGYRNSIQKMEGFMNFLKPELVFQKFRDEPNDEAYSILLERTQKNLEVARLYLGTKLVSIAIIEALSFRIGQDIPISTMMGELPSKSRSTAQLENYLPYVPTYYPPETDVESDVLDLLEKGRSLDSSYDVKNSPTATYIVKVLGFSEVRTLLKKAKDFFKREISSEEFLASCDPNVVETVTKGILNIFESRKAALRTPLE